MHLSTPTPTLIPTPTPARLPMHRGTLVALLDHLDDALREVDCVHDLRRTETFLRAQGLEPAPALAWLARHGGRCDCTVLEHVEDRWLARG
jgi:hypothetical protein